MNRDLTPEGNAILENILKYDDIIKKGLTKPKETKLATKRETQLENEVSWLKMKLIKMMFTSHLVVEDCNEILKNLPTIEGYLNSDAKVAKTLHIKFADRLNRILMGKSAYEDESHLRIPITKLLMASR